MTKDKKITDGQKLKEAFWEVYKRPVKIGKG